MNEPPPTLLDKRGILIPGITSRFPLRKAISNDMAAA